MSRRTDALNEVADAVLAVERTHPVRVAIDGCSAAGKTTLADELADTLRARTDREVIRAEIDHFKRAPELRTAYPIESPESYYLDTWDQDAIRQRQSEWVTPWFRRHVLPARCCSLNARFSPCELAVRYLSARGYPLIFWVGTRYFPAHNPQYEWVTPGSAGRFCPLVEPRDGANGDRTRLRGGGRPP